MRNNYEGISIVELSVIDMARQWDIGGLRLERLKKMIFRGLLERVLWVSILKRFKFDLHLEDKCVSKFGRRVCVQGL